MGLVCNFLSCISCRKHRIPMIERNQSRQTVLWGECLFMARCAVLGFTSVNNFSANINTHYWNRSTCYCLNNVFCGSCQSNQLYNTDWVSYRWERTFEVFQKKMLPKIFFSFTRVIFYALQNIRTNASTCNVACYQWTTVKL